MAQLVLVHWNQAEVEARAEALREAGHSVECVWRDGGAWKPDPLPERLLISLERLPSHGRAVADWFWSAKSRRTVPILFIGGTEETVSAFRERFPDATFVNWPALAHELP